MPKKLPRGLRNHNPLNIVNTAQQWCGQVGHDGRFCIFESDEYGYRAAFRLLRTYNKKYSIYTVRRIIERWAPSSENDTIAYIKRVCDYTGLKQNDFIVVSNPDYEWKAMQLVAGMAYVENGVDIDTIQREKIQKGYNLAFWG